METIRITYNQKDISSDVSQYLISLTYSDKVEGESDEISLAFEDVDTKWINSWYPSKGDTIQVFINTLDCGEFQVDEIDYTVSPSVINIRGLATGFVNNRLRTKRSAAYENQTLSQLAAAIAKKNKLSVIGDIRKDITFKRVTQNYETDLAFLKRIAKQYGYVFAVRKDKLIFYDTFKIEKTDPVTEIKKTDMISGSFKDKTAETYASANVRYHNSKTEEVVNASVDASDNDNGSDTLEIQVKVEDKGQAEEMAKAGLHEKNSEKVTGSISTIGDTRLVAGVTFKISDMGKFNGTYYIKESAHTVSKSDGYKTQLEIKRVNA